MKKLLLIVNPKAGKLAAKAVFYEIIQAFALNGFLVTTYITRAAGDASSMAKSATESGEYDLLVCLGGDGTLNETVNGILQSGKSIPLGYIPTGSTNDIANSLEIAADPIAAAKNIAGTENKVILDAGRFNRERFFAYTASFGAFTSTAYSVPQEMKNTFGHFAYLLAGIKDIASIKPYRVTVESGNETFTGDYIFGTVANSFSLAGLIKFDRKKVDLNDGLFEVLLVKQPENMGQLNKIVAGAFGSDFSDKEVFTFFKTDKISFEMPEDANWTLDGEFAEGRQHILIENVKSAIELRHNK